MWLTRPSRGAAPAALVLALAAALAPSRVAPIERPADRTFDLLALNGFDPVSYFLGGGPLPGSARYELNWGGQVWRFRTASDRAAFGEAPAVYAPRLGGHDAVGVLDGRIVDADPLVFAVIGGRLYLFRDAGRRARFLADPGLAARAEAAWPTLRGLMDAPPVEAKP